jgi:hypothetical protein
MFASLRSAAIGLALVAGAVGFSGAASAQTFTFAGTTAGCFGPGCAPAPAASTGTLGFTAGAFNVLAPAVVGGQASIGNSPTGNNLGEFSLAAGNANFNGQSFTLAVSFLLPVGTAPNTGTFNATLTGFVVANAGGVTVDFNNAPIAFTFPEGAFTLQVNDLDVSVAGTQVPVTGKIMITAVPGPVVGAGVPALLGLAGVWFYRRRKQTSEA